MKLSQFFTVLVASLTFFALTECSTLVKQRRAVIPTTYAPECPGPIYNRIPNGVDLVSPVTVPNIFSCCAQCVATPGCNVWLYSTANRSCYSRSATMPVSVVVMAQWTYGLANKTDGTTAVKTTSVQTSAVQTTDIEVTVPQSTASAPEDTLTGAQLTGGAPSDEATTTTGAQQTTGTSGTTGTTGVQSTGVQTTGVQTTGVQTTGVQTTGVQTTGVKTTRVQTTSIQTTSVAAATCNAVFNRVVTGTDVTPAVVVVSSAACCDMCIKKPTANHYVYWTSNRSCACRYNSDNFANPIQTAGLYYAPISGRDASATTTGVQVQPQTTAVKTTGAQTTALQTTAVQTTAVQTTDVQSTGVQTTGAVSRTTGVVATVPSTTGSSSVTDPNYPFPDASPLYHFRPESGWMGDICGPFVYMGIYHMFYQRRAIGDNLVSWGHAVSTDMLGWKILPAIMYADKWYDNKGVFDGSTFFLADGTPAIIYCGIYRGATKTGYLGTVNMKSMNLAYPVNISDPFLTVWRKAASNPVIETAPDNLLVIADPSEIWQTSDGLYHMLVGSGRNISTASTLQYYLNIAHFASKNLTSGWSYQGDYSQPIPGINLQPNPGFAFCPEYYKLDGEDVVFRHPTYSIAQIDPVSHNLTSATIPARMDNGQTVCFKTFDDSINHQRISYAWLDELDNFETSRSWSGVMTLPHVLNVVNRTYLTSQPPPGLLALRGQHWSIPGPIAVQSPNSNAATYRLPGVMGDSLEIRLNLNWTAATQCDVRVRASTNSEEFTRFWFRYSAGTMGVDRTSTTANQSLILPSRYGTDTSVTKIRTPKTFAGRPDILPIVIYIDRSVVEAYVLGGLYQINNRIYPSRFDSLYVDLASISGTCTFSSVEVWTLGQISPSL